MSNQDLSDLAMEMYYKTAPARRIAADAVARKSRRASRPLCAIAIANTFGLLMTAGVMQNDLAKGVSEAWVFTCVAAGLTAAFWALWGWSLVNPLPAAIVGVLLYTSIWDSLLAHFPKGPPNAAIADQFLIGLISIGFLAKAVINASSERRMLLAQSETADASQPKRRRSIASAIALYIALLGIVVIPISLQADRDFNFHDLMDVHRLMGIVIVTWAIIAWRDTRPAVRNTASGKWYLMALLCGVLTSVFASLYADIVNAMIGVKAPSLSEPFLENEMGWLGVIGIIALFPAVFEETAFRGIILPCLQRLLSDKEAIFVSGAMFMILHLSPTSAPPLLAVGLVLGYLRVKSGSLWPCVLLHFTHNALIVAFEHWHF
jgi:uncharacterized protein